MKKNEHKKVKKVSAKKTVPSPSSNVKRAKTVSSKKEQKAKTDRQEPGVVREPLKTKKSEADKSEKVELPVGNQDLRTQPGEGIQSFVEVPVNKKTKSPAPSPQPTTPNSSAGDLTDKLIKYIPRLKKKYFYEIVPSLMKEFDFKSPMRAPRLEKIALNQGVGDAVADRKIMDAALNEMSIITGQKSIATISKKDISNFKVRKGVPIGAKVTLRSDIMYEFLDRFISTALPRIRDFRGISKHGFDGRGNYTLGITEQIIFPEINIDKVNKVRGMDITFVTSARNNAEAMALLKYFGMPFRKEDDEIKEKKRKKSITFAPIVATKDNNETKKQA